QRYQVKKKRPQTEAQAQRNMMVYLKNIAGFTLDYFKGMSYDDIRPIFEAKFNANLNLPSEWKTHNLIWRNKDNLEEHSLDDLFNSLRIYEAKVKHSFSPVSAATSAFAICAQLPVRSPKDNRRTVSSEPQRRHVIVETSTSNALVSSCDGIGSYDWSYQAEEEPANFALMAIPSSSSISDNEARDSVLVTLKQKLNQAEKERDDLKLKFDKFQSSSQSLTKLLANQTNSKHGLGYHSESNSKSFSQSSFFDRSQPNGEYHVVPPPITGNFMPPKLDLVFHTALIVVETAHSAFTIQLSPAKSTQDISHPTRPMATLIEDWVSDSEDESEPKNPQRAPSFVQTFEHANLSGRSILPVQAPILDATPNPTSLKTNGSSKRKNRKTCFVCKGVDHLIKDCNFQSKPKHQSTPRNFTHRGYDKQYASSTKKYPQKHIVPAVILTKSKPVSVTVARPVSAVVLKIMATKPRHACSLHTKTNSIIRRHKTCSKFSKTSNSSPKVTTAHAKVGNPQYALKDKGVIDSGCSRHMTGNMSDLSDFQELNGRYVSFGGEEADQQYMLFPVWFIGSTNPLNKEEDATFDGKEYDAEKPESIVNLSSSSSALSGEQDDITKKKDKGKSPVDYFIRNKDFNEDFKDYSEDSSNDISAAGPIVPTAGQNYSNNTTPLVLLVLQLLETLRFNMLLNLLILFILIMRMLIIADAIAELNSFHEVRLALIDCRIVCMRNFHWLEKKAL
nr:hypothetical protein [Tanacetum cinerariifolium]